MKKKKKFIISIVILLIIILTVLITSLVRNSNSPNVDKHEAGDAWVEHNEITEQPEGYDEAYFECYGITEDDVYDSYDAIDFDLIEPGTPVFYRGEHGEIIHMMNTPQLTEEMIASMWNWVNSFEDFTVSKTVSIRTGDKDVYDNLVMMEHNGCAFNRYNHTYTVTNSDSIVKLPLLDASSLNSNEEFLSALLKSEGLDLNWTTHDEPIVFGVYSPEYKFANVESEMIQNAMTYLIEEYSIKNIIKVEANYVLDDSRLLFINITTHGTLESGESIRINVNYGVMMC